mgnify:CR=1 FL=1
MITTLALERKHKNGGFRLLQFLRDLSDGGGVFVYAAADGGPKPKGGYNYWVRLVPGNGADVLVDYTTNLEAAIKLGAKEIK